MYRLGAKGKLFAYSFLLLLTVTLAFAAISKPKSEKFLKMERAMLKQHEHS